MSRKKTSSLRKLNALAKEGEREKEGPRVLVEMFLKNRGVKGGKPRVNDRLRPREREKAMFEKGNFAEP